MAFLINRTHSGRLLCLHGLLQYVSHHWGDGPYEIKNFKFDATKSPDIHDFSPCLSTEYGFKSCRFLENPASLAGCGLVNSLVEDTQKSKNASDVFNALDGLGLITRNGNTAIITDLGKKFISASRETEAWEVIARDSVNNYGPFAGLLYLTSQFSDSKMWARGDVRLGFPETGEEVIFDGELVALSTGSQRDTITRSRSSLVSWGVATGYFVPNKYVRELTDEPSQVQFNRHLMSATMADGFWNSQRVYEVNPKAVSRPLSYNQLVKSFKSLRENGQEAQREASRTWETVIKNRRLAIAYALNQSALIGKPLIFEELSNELSKMPQYVINKTEMLSTLATELGNAFVIGTPYQLLSGNLLQGMRRVDLSVLSNGAAVRTIEQLEALVSNSKLFGP